MAIKLVVNAAESDVVAFSIDLSLYYAKLTPVIRIFDADLLPQIIPNIDLWFQAKTQQRYSYRNFLDMVESFINGSNSNYSPKTFNILIRQMIIATKFAILERLPDYKKHFWIESLDSVAITSWSDKIRDGFESFRQKMGDDGFANYLCRFWRAASRYNQNAMLIIEKFISRLGRIPNDPKYPPTNDLDNELVSTIMTKFFGKGMEINRAVPAIVLQRMRSIKGG